MEVRENIIEVLEHCEFEEGDVDLEEIDQEELEVCEDYVHLPDAPREDQYICQRLGRRKFLQVEFDAQRLGTVTRLIRGPILIRRLENVVAPSLKTKCAVA